MSRTDAQLRLQPDPARYTLPCLLEDAASRHGTRSALHFEGADWSYADVDREVRRMARGLAAAGVGKGARVALCMANRPEWIFAFFAVARVGGVVVPVSTFASPEERDYILRHSDASVLLIQRRLAKRDLLGELLERHPEIAGAPAGAIRCPALPQLRTVHCLGVDHPLGAVEPLARLSDLAEDVPDALVDAMASDVRPSDDGVLIYTSGTTAHPKGVLHRQRAPVILSWRYAELYGLSPEDVIWSAQPFFWTAGISMTLGQSLAVGARLVLQEVFDPAVALDLFERQGVTTPFAWGHQEKALAEQAAAGDYDLHRLTRVNASSPLAACAGVEEDTWGFRGAYGLSETFTLVTSHAANAPAEERNASSGPPLPGMQIRILDPAKGAPERRGEEGEIAVRGLSLMSGYYKVDPELYLDGAGYFHTQDSGSIDAQGELHWEGRLSNMIKTGGANVSPVEIEAALEGYPGLRLGQAVGIPHPVLGEVIVLCAAASGSPPLDPEGLRAHLRERLAPYKVPRRVLVFGADELSFTGNQKLQVAPLREAALARLQEEGAEIAGVRYRKPAPSDPAGSR